MNQELVDHGRKRKCKLLLFCVVPAFCFFMILFVYAGKKSFFSDEMDQLGILVSVHSFKELLMLYASVGHEVAPPLFASCAWLWMKIVPFSQQSLQTLSILLTSFGVIFLGLAGNSVFKDEKKKIFLLPAILSFFMPSVSLTAGMQFRQYGLLFCLSSLLIWLFFSRYNQFEVFQTISWKLIFVYGVVIAGLPYTHYISVLLPVGLFFVDTIQVARKKMPPKIFISYFWGAFLFLPWGLSILRAVSSRTEFWLDKPRFLDVLQTLFFLTDGNAPGFVFALFILGMVTTSLLAFGKTRKDNKTDVIFPVLLSIVPFFMIGIVFVYSKINPTISLFLDRYFLVLIPLFAVIETKGIADIIQILQDSCVGFSKAAPFLISTMILFVFLVGLISLQNTVQTDTETIYEPYHEAADLINEQPDINMETTAVFTSNLSRYVTQGWESLYLDPNRDHQFSVYDYSNSDSANSDFLTIYTFVEHAALPEQLAKYLSSQYYLDPEFAGDYHVYRYCHK